MSYSNKGIIAREKHTGNQKGNIGIVFYIQNITKNQLSGSVEYRKRDAINLSLRSILIRYLLRIGLIGRIFLIGHLKILKGDTHLHLFSLHLGIRTARCTQAANGKKEEHKEGTKRTTRLFQKGKEERLKHNGLKLKKYTRTAERREKNPLRLSELKLQQGR